jgi:peptidoglycan/LPS O-acetylase OafA/YrhL
VRLIAAVNIFLLHVAGPHFKYGWSWVQFFFMLSGFVTMHGRQQSKTARAMSSCLVAQLPSCTKLCTRIVSIYPTYFIAFCAMLLISTVVPTEFTGQPQMPFVPYVFSVEITMMQSLVSDSLTMLPVGSDWSGCHTPQRSGSRVAVLGQGLNQRPVAHEGGREPRVHCGDSYNFVDWYISALLVCWLLEEPLLSRASLGAATGASLAASAVGLCTWVVLWPPVAFPLLWAPLTEGGYAAVTDPDAKVREYMPFPSWALPVALRYTHLYYCGALVAAVLHARARSGKPALRCWPAVIGSVSLLVLLVVLPACLPLRTKGWIVNGVFSPFFVPQLLLLAGLAEGADPLAQAANALPKIAGICRELALPLYLLQLVVIKGLGHWLSEALRLEGAALVVVELLVLVSLSAIVAYGVQGPCNSVMRRLLQPPATLEVRTYG